MYRKTFLLTIRHLDLLPQMKNINMKF